MLVLIETIIEYRLLTYHLFFSFELILCFFKDEEEVKEAAKKKEKKEEEAKKEEKKEPEANFEMLQNPARVMRQQVQFFRLRISRKLQNF
jgi:hypothetical protein